MSFNEKAVYETLYSFDPDNVHITPAQLDDWTNRLEKLAPIISTELTTLGIPDTEDHRSTVLVLAFLYRQGTVSDRIQRAAWFYRETGMWAA